MGMISGCIGELSWMFFFRKKPSQPRRLIILNPAASRGDGLSEFERVKAALREKLTDFDLYITRGPQDASHRTREALLGRTHDQIIAAGGDGTINEVLNGYFDGNRILSRKVPLGVVDLNSGADFIRTLRELSDGYDVALQQNRWIWADIGQVELLPIMNLGLPRNAKQRRELERTIRDLKKETQIQRRLFINIASSGMSGHIVRSLFRSRIQSGAFAYYYHSLKTFLSYKSTSARVLYCRDENSPWEELSGPLLNLFVCNGRYNGGGMLWAPPAYLDDGYFHAVHMTPAPTHKMISDSRHFYDGLVDQIPGLQSFQAKRILLIPTITMDSETDGELLPMMGVEGAPAARMLLFSVVPRSIPLII